MAAIDFPSNPSDGDEFSNYVYDGITGVWNNIGVSYLTDFNDVYIPGTPADGAVLTYSTSASSWVADETQAIKPGMISAFAGATIPSGYILCDGSEVLKASYPNLYNAIADKYNTGSEASTKFRLPNLVGRIPVGKDAAQTEFTPLGKYAGAKTHTLTLAEMAYHTHIQNPHTHDQNSHLHTQDAHSHGISISFNPSGWEAGGYGLRYGGTFYDRCAVTGGWGIGTDGRTPYIQTAAPANSYTQATNQNTGGGGSHNNMQPSLVINYAIKY
jgi:microcystin-dependent protein